MNTKSERIGSRPPKVINGGLVPNGFSPVIGKISSITPPPRVILPSGSKLQPSTSKNRIKPSQLQSQHSLSKNKNNENHPPRNSRLIDMVTFNTSGTAAKGSEVGASRMEQYLQNPLCPSAKFNRTVDYPTYVNVNSTGFTSRIVNEANNSLNQNSTSNSPLSKQLASSLSKFSHSSTAIRIVPPPLKFVSSANIESGSNDDSGCIHVKEKSSRTCTNTIRDLPRKRNYHYPESPEDKEAVKRSKKSEMVSTFGPVSQNKRVRDENAIEGSNTAKKQKRQEEDEQEEVEERKAARLLSYTSSMAILMPNISHGNNAIKIKKRKAHDEIDNDKGDEKQKKLLKIQLDTWPITESKKLKESEAQTVETRIKEGDLAGISSIKPDKETSEEVIRSEEVGEKEIEDEESLEIKIGRGRILNRANNSFVRRRIAEEDQTPFRLAICQPGYTSPRAKNNSATATTNQCEREDAMNKLLAGDVKDAMSILLGHDQGEGLPEITKSLHFLKGDADTLDSSSVQNVGTNIEQEQVIVTPKKPLTSILSTPGSSKNVNKHVTFSVSDSPTVCESPKLSTSATHSSPSMTIGSNFLSSDASTPHKVTTSNGNASSQTGELCSPLSLPSPLSAPDVDSANKSASSTSSLGNVAKESIAFGNAFTKEQLTVTSTDQMASNASAAKNQEQSVPTSGTIASPTKQPFALTSSVTSAPVGGFSFNPPIQKSVAAPHTSDFQSVTSIPAAVLSSAPVEGNFSFASQVQKSILPQPMSESKSVTITTTSNDAAVKFTFGAQSKPAVVVSDISNPSQGTEAPVFSANQTHSFSASPAVIGGQLTGNKTECVAKPFDFGATVGQGSKSLNFVSQSSTGTTKATQSSQQNTTFGGFSFGGQQNLDTSMTTSFSVNNAFAPNSSQSANLSKPNALPFSFGTSGNSQNNGASSTQSSFGPQPTFSASPSQTSFMASSSLPIFGASSQSTFGMPSSQTTFGTSSSQPSFGASSQTTFGASPSQASFGSSTFGTIEGQKTPLFDSNVQQQQQPTFGNPEAQKPVFNFGSNQATFGAGISTFGAQQSAVIKPAENKGFNFSAGAPSGVFPFVQNSGVTNASPASQPFAFNAPGISNAGFSIGSGGGSTGNSSAGSTSARRRNRARR